MTLAYDARVNLHLLVALLNSAPGIAGSADALATPEALNSFAAEHGFTGQIEASILDVAAAAKLRERFRVTLNNDVDLVVTAINQTMSEIRAFPRLVRHGDWGWHTHMTGDTAPLGERMASDIAQALIDLVRFGDLARLRRCAAEDCDAALADFTKNRSKRFCDVRNCANRTHIASYRARREQQIP